MTTCLVCGDGAFEPHLDVLVRCRACGFVTAQDGPCPDATELYGDGYFSGNEYYDYARDKPFIQRNFRHRLADVRRRVPGGRLMEIGAAYGFFLELAAAHFETIGFEINVGAAAHARERLGLDVRTCDFLDVPSVDLGGPVDVTVMWDVIEHLPRPDLVLAKAAAVSPPGALVYITTGDIGSVLARWRGRKWRMIHPPTHLHYFSRATLSRLLERVGYRVVDVRAVPVARGLRQIAYSVLVLGLHRPALFEGVREWMPATAGLTLNTFDIMQVVAERTDAPAT